MLHWHAEVHAGRKKQQQRMVEAAGLTDFDIKAHDESTCSTVAAKLSGTVGEFMQYKTFVSSPGN